MISHKYTTDANLLLEKEKYKNGNRFLMIGLHVVKAKYLLNIERV